MENARHENAGNAFLSSYIHNRRPKRYGTAAVRVSSELQCRCSQQQAVRWRRRRQLRQRRRRRYRARHPGLKV